MFSKCQPYVNNYITQRFAVSPVCVPCYPNPVSISGRSTRPHFGGGPAQVQWTGPTRGEVSRSPQMQTRLEPPHGPGGGPGEETGEEPSLPRLSLLSGAAGTCRTCFVRPTAHSHFMLLSKVTVFVLHRTFLYTKKGK